jgi:uncharacterized protein YuzE
MKICYDEEADALSIFFRDTTVTTQELAEGLTVEYDKDGCLVGLEILDVMKQLGDATIFRQVILEGMGPAAPFVERSQETE